MTRRADQADTYVVAEVSVVINELDVHRATRRAELPAGATAGPVLAVVPESKSSLRQSRAHEVADDIPRALTQVRAGEVEDGLSLVA